MSKITLIATAAMGIEALVAKEVRDLGYENVTVDNGKVTIEADESAICRTNLWLRTADRVKLKIGEFKATTFDELFEKTKALPWGDFIPENGEFPVIGKSVKSKLFSVSDCQAIVKKAVVEKLKHHYKRTTWFEENGPLFRIEVALLKDIVTLTIDTSGTGLHKRGYRAEQGIAPLKETLAATLVLLTNWNPDRPFVDPFCGSGTIPIEAALIGQNIAPGFNREFVSQNWHWIRQEDWDKAFEEAEDLAKYDQALDISGSDIDHRMIEIAKGNALEAGFGDIINFKQMQVKDFTTKKEYGVIVGNPPYGERLGEKEEVEHMYREMGKAFEPYDTWSVYMLTSHPDFEKLYGKDATKKRKLFNGFIQTNYYQYWGKRPQKK
ncbi:THUMP domain-containing class I SAM-dependent RNA methyltransferase [Schinkia azotoformans]|uniref:THUMP domain-containing class I SAM-dependent RNA methyltransferase n=1 Tax=Schinkia azotoformans TaxID=1454 RepID=UPI002DBE0E7C|nr:class I SAM-dependent RNA methyltransferase [Schinkia azotoformans]MEC1739356.1 class I SAM-dependent RNA methyltransferase [Schinkia azotoformans]MEC1765904.1 class I SAM-dependent RNA methyltransferase [Schinkia azotoformans]MEC1785899.1 class I SAM-dependent RNA methyltransferase [Schinkia azotoformans]MED4377140.1 class I SAM-dependent RNA methyltransferase [Schinkia azotoformans]MED4418130.1 class I SAM-dependent RNA methyltransferase [Schinkia azotoformans]